MNLDPEHPKRIANVASNPAVSGQTGWPIGFWWSELTHPYWELTERGYRVDVFSPRGGTLEGDSWSDPRDGSGYSAYDLISLGFINSPEHMKLVEFEANSDLGGQETAIACGRPDGVNDTPEKSSAP